MPDSPPPETLAWLRQSAAVDGAAYSQVLLHLLDRVEALEARPISGAVELDAPTPEAAPVATNRDLLDKWIAHDTVQEALRSCYDLGRQHGAAQPPAAQPAPPVAPDGGLVERVRRAIGDDAPCSHSNARAAIREVATWLRSDYGGREGYGTSWANLIEEEADR